MRTFLALLLVSLFLMPSKPVAAEDEALITKIIENVHPGIFRLHDPRDESSEPAPPSEEEHALIVALEDQPNGGKRYDVLEWLIQSGITARPGQVAVFMPNDHAIVFTGTAEDHDLVERAVESIGISQGLVKLLELSITAWTYLDDPAALVNNHAKTFDQIRVVAGDSLRPIDSHLILTRSGNRAISVQQLAGGEEPPKPAKSSETPAALTSPGSIVAVEPVLGPDGATIDFQVEYRARIPQPDGARDLCFSHATNASVADGRNVILQNLLFPPIAGQDPAKVRRCAIILSARVLSTEEKESPKLTPAEKEKRDQQIIADALKGLEKPKEKTAPRNNPLPKVPKITPSTPAR